MSTAELKINLINQITEITDNEKLEDLLQILQFQSDSSVYITSEEDKNAIQESRTQITNGNFFSNEAVQQEIKEWLNK